MIHKGKKFDVVDGDFRTFVEIWNQQRMKMRTPKIHKKIINWLEHCWVRKERNLLLMAFRASGKSTLAGLFAAWLLYRNPDLRILVLAADYTLAKKMVRNVKRIIERHPFTKDMKPDNPDQWAGDRFTVKRFLVQRDPSMMAKGITSNITGSRADIVICDDVEVPNTCDTAEKREELRARLSEINYIIGDNHGTQLYIGTPHTYYTVYAAQPRAETGEDQAFLYGFKRLEIPLLDKDGECAWPEKYSEETIENIKRQSGPNKFASQMLLRAVNITDGRLNPAQLQFYTGGLHYSKELDQLHINGKVMVSANAWWDPAFGSRDGDASVLAVVFTGEDGCYYLHRLEYFRIDSFDPEDEATQQCRKAAFIAQLLRLPSITLETNGIGKLLPGILRKALKEKNVPCSVREVSNNRPKALRIVEAFDAPLAARMLYAHDSVRETSFVTEMREWQPGSRGPDDGLDAVAGALSQAPLRMARHFPVRGQQSWPKGAKNHKAKTDFKI